jgi:hypothetical protein
MEEVLDGIRRVLWRWVRTSTPLTANVAPGDTLLPVANTKRFRVGENCIIQGQSDAEVSVTVNEIVDTRTIRIGNPLTFAHLVSDNATLVKAVNNQIVQSVFIGDPAVIPGTALPAITINGTDETSQEWMTLDSTKEVYNLEISVYVLESTQEDGYRYLMRLAKVIEHGLKANIFPLINEFDQIAITGDILAGDIVVRVADTSLLAKGYHITIEDTDNQDRLIVRRVIDSEHVEVYVGVCYDFDVDDDPILILPHRQLFNSWPERIDYGFVHKGTLMKAARIKWFGWEEQIQPIRGQKDTWLT